MSKPKQPITRISEVDHEKTGKYTWDPSEWLWAEKRYGMSLEARGAYRDLVDWYHYHGSIVAAERAILNITGCSDTRQLRRIWKCIEKHFDLREGRYYLSNGNEYKPALQAKRKRDTRRHSISKKLRFEILERDGYKCRYCGVGIDVCPLDIDHIIPVSKGGANVFSNLVAACSSCNMGKGARCLGVTPDA